MYLEKSSHTSFGYHYVYGSRHWKGYQEATFIRDTRLYPVENSYLEQEVMYELYLTYNL